MFLRKFVKKEHYVYLKCIGFELTLTGSIFFVLFRYY